MRTHFDVFGQLDQGRPTRGKVSVDRDRGLFIVRPLRGREYVLPLDDVAAIVVAKVVKAELSR